MIWPERSCRFLSSSGLWPPWQVLGAVLLLGAVTLTVIRTAKRFPYLAVGWLWFAGTLVPVIGIVQVGYSGHGRPLHLYPPDRVVHHGGMGRSGTLEKLAPTAQEGAFCLVGIDPLHPCSSLHGHRSGTGAITLRCMIIP